MTATHLGSRGWLAECSPFFRRPPALGTAARSARLSAACQQAEESSGPRCQGSREVACQECSGSGRLPRGGYQKKNPVSAARVIDSKWTAMERTFGWRHFRVTQKRKEGKETFVLMVSTCDESTQFWLNMRNLRERERWASGWLQKKEIQAEAEVAGAECKGCGGSGRRPCPLCSQGGEVVAL